MGAERHEAKEGGAGSEVLAKRGFWVGIVLGGAALSACSGCRWPFQLTGGAPCGNPRAPGST